MGGPTSGKLFICYRRADTVDVTGRIYDRLTGRFGRDNVFKDVDSIPLGTDFRVHIDATIKQCSAGVVVIGQRWLEKNAEGGLRIKEDDDYVRLEIESLLGRNVPVIPVLVHEAHLPEKEQLPESIRALRSRQSASIRADPHFNSDVNLIINNLEGFLTLGAVAPSQVPPTVETAKAVPSSVDRDAISLESSKRVDPATNAPRDLVRDRQVSKGSEKPSRAVAAERPNFNPPKSSERPPATEARKQPAPATDKWGKGVLWVAAIVAAVAAALYFAHLKPKNTDVAGPAATSPASANVGAPAATVSVVALEAVRIKVVRKSDGEELYQGPLQAGESREFPNVPLYLTASELSALAIDYKGQRFPTNHSGHDRIQFDFSER